MPAIRSGWEMTTPPRRDLPVRAVCALDGLTGGRRGVAYRALPRMTRRARTLCSCGMSQ